MKEKTLLHIAFFLAWVPALFLFSACAMPPKSHIGEEAVADERIELKNTDEEHIWRTDDLAVHYNITVEEQSFDVHGFVIPDTGITYTFPSADHLSLHVYLLDNDGVVIDRRTVRPNIAFYSTFTEKAGFSATITYRQHPSFIAFGYRGSFYSIEEDEGGGRRGYEKLVWEIASDPF